jgi:DNA-binding PadR family transcriptional regulator
MRHRHHGCGPRGQFEINIPEGLQAMRGGRGWRGSWGPFQFDVGDEDGVWGKGGPRGRRTRRMFESGELRLVLLKLIADEPRHGYDLIRAIEELTGGEYAPSPGVVYPTLTLLEEMGLIEHAPGEGARKPFQVTDEGREHLEQNGEQAEELIRRLTTLNRSHSPASPIWRAMRNLGFAIRNRVAQGEIGEDTKFELAALIDDLAQKIERLK